MQSNPDHPGPRLIDPATGNPPSFSFHSFIVKTGHHTILIDSLPRQRQRASDPAAIPSAADLLCRRSRPRRGRVSTM